MKDNDNHKTEITPKQDQNDVLAKKVGNEVFRAIMSAIIILLILFMLFFIGCVIISSHQAYNAALTHLG